MVVGGKYELGAVAAECAGWRTFDGREIPSGRAVLVHQILEPPSGSQRPTPVGLAERYGHVIDSCSCDGVEYVVTEALPRGAGEERFTRVGAWRVPASFRTPPAAGPAEASVSGIFTAPQRHNQDSADWATGGLGEGETKPSQAGKIPGVSSGIDRPVEEAPAPAASAPSEFTQLFQAKASADTPAPPPAPVPAEASVSGIFTAQQSRNQDRADWARGGPGEGEKKPSEAGKILRGRSTDRPVEEAPAPAPMAPSEFTQLFQAKVPAETPPPPTSGEPGDFTRMFQTPVTRNAPARPAAPLAPPAKSAPGEFTQFFQPSLGSTPFEAPSSPVRQAEPPAPSPGEYTRLFRSPAPPPSQTRSSGATGVFHTPSSHSPAMPLPADAGPSDFTRMIQSQPQPTAEAKPPEAPKAAPREPAAKKPAVPAVLIAVLAALAVLAIGMVLFFALRR